MFAGCVPAPVTRLPGSASGTCFAGSHSPWSPPFAPPAPLQLPPPQTAPQSLPTPVHHRLRLLTFPMRTRSTHGLWSDAGYPRFRRDPFARDVALDPGGTTMPRIAALHMLRSTMKTVSAPAISSFRGSIPHPTHALCTLCVRRCRRLTQHSLPGDPLWPYLRRTCTD